MTPGPSEPVIKLTERENTATTPRPGFADQARQGAPAAGAAGEFFGKPWPGDRASDKTRVDSNRGSARRSLFPAGCFADTHRLPCV